LILANMKALPCFLVTALLAAAAVPVRGAQNGAGAPRVVSLAPNITEIICAIGAVNTLVGRTSACDYPRAALKDIPVVGGFGAPALEALVAARPTIVLAVDLEDDSVAGMIGRYGIAYRRLACARLVDIPAAIRLVGEITGCEARAGQAAADFEKRLCEMRSAAGKLPAGSRPSVFAEIWSDPIMTAGSASLVDDLVSLAGGRNIAGEINKEYFNVSPEWVIARDPDLVVCLGHAAAAKIEARPGWKQLRAVRAGRVFTCVDGDLVLRAGPRVLDGAAVLSEFISGNKTNKNAASVERRIK